MRPPNDLSREELESTLKRVAKLYAQGRITKERFDSFSETIEAGFEQLDEMDEEMTSGEA